MPLPLSVWKSIGQQLTANPLALPPFFASQVTQIPPHIMAAAMQAAPPRRARKPDQLEQMARNAAKPLQVTQITTPVNGFRPVSFFAPANGSTRHVNKDRQPLRPVNTAGGKKPVSVPGTNIALSTTFVPARDRKRLP